MKKLFNDLYRHAPSWVPVALLFAIDSLWLHMGLVPYMVAVALVTLAGVWNFRFGMNTMQGIVERIGRENLAIMEAQLAAWEKERDADDKTL